MPAELTTCSAIARAATHQDASSDVLEPKTHACLLPLAAATDVNALLQECDDVVLADLPLALLLPGHARHRNVSLPGVRPPMPVPRRGAFGRVASFLWRVAVAGHVPGTYWTLLRVKLCSHGSVHEEHERSLAALRGLPGAAQPHCQACIFHAQGGYGSAELPPWRGRLVQHWTAQRLQAGFHVLGLGGDGQVCGGPRTLPALRVLSPLAYGMRRRSSWTRHTMLCTT